MRFFRAVPTVVVQFGKHGNHDTMLTSLEEPFILHIRRKLWTAALKLLPLALNCC